MYYLSDESLLLNVRVLALVRTFQIIPVVNFKIIPV